MVDLGKWVSEEYRIPDTKTPLPGAEESDGNDDEGDGA
jgi:endogenous inhibitor of DNA gyrase (YacG/DUF329 family)